MDKQWFIAVSEKERRATASARRLLKSGQAARRHDAAVVGLCKDNPSCIISRREKNSGVKAVRSSSHTREVARPARTKRGRRSNQLMSRAFIPLNGDLPQVPLRMHLCSDERRCVRQPGAGFALVWQNPRRSQISPSLPTHTWMSMHRFFFAFPSLVVVVVARARAPAHTPNLSPASLACFFFFSVCKRRSASTSLFLRQCGVLRARLLSTCHRVCVSSREHYLAVTALQSAGSICAHAAPAPSSVELPHVRGHALAPTSPWRQFAASGIG